MTTKREILEDGVLYWEDEESGERVPIEIGDLVSESLVTEVSRTEQEPVYNVKTYGAEGDGTTDDSAAINDAINAIDSEDGGTLYFPAGEYRLTKDGDQVNIDKSNVYVYGPEATILVEVELAFYVNRDGDVNNIVENVTFDGLHFVDPDPEAHEPSQEGWDDETHGIQPWFVDNFTVKNCTFVSIGDEAVEIRACHGVTATNNHFKDTPSIDPTGACVAIQDREDRMTEGVNFSENYMTESRTGRAFQIRHIGSVGEKYRGVRFCDNTITDWNCDDAVAVIHVHHEGDPGAEDFYIRDNTISTVDNAAYAIYLNSDVVDGIQVKGNTIRDGGGAITASTQAAIHDAGNSPNVHVKDNSITDWNRADDGSGVSVDRGLVSSNYVNGVNDFAVVNGLIISGNHALNADRAIRGGVDGCIITSNFIQNSTRGVSGISGRRMLSALNFTQDVSPDGFNADFTVRNDHLSAFDLSLRGTRPWDVDGDGIVFEPQAIDPGSVSTVEDSGRIISQADDQEFGFGRLETADLSSFSGVFDGEIRRNDGTAGTADAYYRWDDTAAEWVRIGDETATIAPA